MAEEKAEFPKSKIEPLLFFENRLFCVVGENDHNLNVYYLCNNNTNSRVKCNGSNKIVGYWRDCTFKTLY